jgi:acyl homoserine lactone synthase
MLLLVRGHEARSRPDLMTQMFELRARVFSGRLGWAVEVHDGQERDRFDDLDPLYALSLTDDDKVVGTFRILRTTGPHMLSEVFRDLLPGGAALRSPTIWESTRFCVDTRLARTKSGNGLSHVTGKLLASLLEIGVYAGLTHIITVVDLRMERVLRRAACPIDRLAPPRTIGGIPTVAILMECTESSVQRVRAANKIETTCVSPERVAQLARAA